MSLRIQFSAFDLNECKKQLGSKNAKLAEQAIQNFEEVADEVDLDEDAIEDGKARIKSLIAGGKKEPVETFAEVSAVNFIASNSAESIEDECESEYTWQELNDMNVQFQKRFDDRTKELFNYCVEGRAMIGHKFDSDAGFYSYLTNAEISELRNGLYQLYSVVSEIVDSGAMNEQDFDGKLVDSLESFNETLEVIHTSDLDLFASSC